MEEGGENDVESIGGGRWGGVEGSRVGGWRAEVGGGGVLVVGGCSVGGCSCSSRGQFRLLGLLVVVAVAVAVR